VITGFLGCGKTSFLRKLLPLCEDAGVRPALIINEVGDIDVDGELLADLHAEQVRLVGGCVCCTLQSQLTETIYNVIENKLGDVIIIECSGLSNPVDVVNALSTPALVREIAISNIICLLDTKRAIKLLGSIELAKSQVSSSNITILNKLDLADADMKTDTANLTRELAPYTEIHHASYGDIGRDRMLNILTDSASVVSVCECDCTDPDHHHEHSHTLPASFCTTALSLPETMSQSGIERLLQYLPEYVIRAKGFAYVEGTGWQILHKVYETINITPLNGPAPKAGPILVCIGQRLIPEELIKLSDDIFT
jgi:G3E family GTPase